MQLVGKTLDFSRELKNELNRSLVEAEARLSVAEKRIEDLELRADGLGAEVAAEVRHRMGSSLDEGPSGSLLN